MSDGCSWCGSKLHCRSVLGVFLCEVCRVLWLVYGKNPHDAEVSS